MGVPAQPRLAARLAVHAEPRYVVAVEARMSPNMLGAIVSGRHRPSPQQCQRIAAALGTTVDELFETVDNVEVGA